MIKKGSQVRVISGKDKGKTGKRHLKPTKENKGGIISKENFIHMSNIKNIDKKKIEKKVVNKK